MFSAIAEAALAVLYWRKGGFCASVGMFFWYAVGNALMAAHHTLAWQHAVMWAVEPVGVLMVWRVVGSAPQLPVMVASAGVHMLLASPAETLVDSAVLQLAALCHLAAGITLAMESAEPERRILGWWWLVSAALYYAAPVWDVSGLVGVVNVVFAVALGLRSR